MYGLLVSLFWRCFGGEGDGFGWFWIEVESKSGNIRSFGRSNWMVEGVGVWCRKGLLWEGSWNGEFLWWFGMCEIRWKYCCNDFEGILK